MKNIILLLFLVLVSIPCLAFSGPPPDRSLMLNLPKDKDLPIILSIEEIKTIPELEGRTVILEGIFAGWDEIGEPKPFSMHDWVLRNDSGEIYVHGAYPEGCDPMDRGTYGKPIHIEGKVESKLVSHFGNVDRVVFIDYLP